MESSPLTTDIILSDSRRILAQTSLAWDPQPGAYLDVADQTYVVLERRHRYHLKAGRYHLQSMALYVQPSPGERWILEGRWVLGDPSCVYSAGSELLRCAVNPVGPCRGCKDYQADIGGANT